MKRHHFSQEQSIEFKISTSLKISLWFWVSSSWILCLKLPISNTYVIIELGISNYTHMNNWICLSITQETTTNYLFHNIRKFKHELSFYLLNENFPLGKFEFHL